MIVFILAYDLCRMQDIDAVYPVQTAAQCIKAPLLTRDIFDQNQGSVEEIVQLYAFQDVSKNPPSEYKHLAVDIQGGLEKIRQQFKKVANISAYDYFASLSSLFLKLKDPHTLYVKSSFYGNFKLRLPFTIYQKDGFWFTQRLSPQDEKIHKGYVKLGLTPDFEEMLDQRIFKINGMEVEDYIMQQARKYCYSSKSDHGCFNSFVGNDLYYQNLKVYNLPEDNDDRMVVQLLNGKHYSVYHVVTTNVVINNSSVAQDLYDKALITDPTQRIIETKKAYMHVLEELDHKPVHQKSIDQSFTVIQESYEFFTLYEHDGYLILAIESFSPPSITQSLSDLYDVMTLIQKSDTHKLVLSLVGNGGGWVSLGHLTAFMLFPEEYPIYGRYSLRKSKLQELLLDSESEFTDAHRTNWSSGEIFSKYVWEDNYTINNTWYHESTQDNFTINYASDDDQEPDLKQILDKIYAFKGVNIDPENIILVTDALCGSTCSCFAKHLVQMKNVKSVGVGGFRNTKDKYDVSSFAGGVVMDSSAFQDSVSKIEAGKISVEDLDYLKSIYIPHDGFQRFAHQSIFSFDSSEDAGIPLEYRSIPVDRIIYDIHPIYGDWQGPDGLKTFVDQAFAISDNITAFGKVCDVDTDTHIVYRERKAECVMYGCELGFYRLKDGSKFTCEQRVDPWLARQTGSGEGDEQNIGMIVGMILLACIIIAIIVILAIFLIAPRLFKHNKITLPTEEVPLITEEGSVQDEEKSAKLADE